jgi:hypothetical protein
VDNVIKPGDLLYHLVRHKFGKVTALMPREIMCDMVEIYYVYGTDKRTYPGYWYIDKCVLVSPDTPQNRLAVQLKHG